jgi:rhamnogalacturonyl hydrolase YesR
MKSEIYKEIFELMKKRNRDEKKRFFLASDKKDDPLILDDLGDYLPFIFYLKEESFAKQYIKDTMKYYPNGLEASHSKFGLKYINIYEYSDFLFGLIEYYKETQEKKVLNYIEKLTDQLVKEFHLGTSPTSFSFYLSSLKIKKIGILENSIGFFIELFVELHRLTKKEKYLELAYHLSDVLHEEKFFKKHSLLQEYTGPFLPSEKKRVRIMKTNTNSLYGFLELYRHTQEWGTRRIIDKWLDSLLKLVDDKPSQYYEFKGGTFHSSQDYLLPPAFALIDFICDYTYFSKDEVFLEKAIKIAEVWLKEQGKTGLFPNRAGTKVSDLDSNTDFSVALVKLFELTQEEKYLKKAKESINAIKKYHYDKKRGLVLGVNIDTGKIENPIIKTKFNFLFFKAKILEDAKYRIYDENLKVYEILKDR